MRRALRQQSTKSERAGCIDYLFLAPLCFHVLVAMQIPKLGRERAVLGSPQAVHSIDFLLALTSPMCNLELSAERHDVITKGP